MLQCCTFLWTWTHVHVRYMLSPFRLSVSLSVSLLSVCNVRAPYSAGWNFRQFFFALWYRGHPLASMEKFTEVVPVKPLRRGGGLNAREVDKIAIFDIWNAVSPKQCKIGGKLVLITNRKSYMSFRLVPKSVTLNELERRNGPHFALFYRIW